MQRLRLLLGIKRLRFRENDARSGRADAEFKARREPVLVKRNWTCAACGYKSKKRTDKAGGVVPSNLDVHHLDDDHHNNAEDNLVPACHTCHPYQHIGELVRRTDVPVEGLGKKTLIACIPEISPADLNLLQRALGAAIKDSAEAEVAKEIVSILAERHVYVKAEFGSSAPADFAKAMSMLTHEQYQHREEAISDLRLLFNADVLGVLGRELLSDNRSAPVSTWDAVRRTVASRKSHDDMP